jgi:ubiquinone/menaquinone biosynthesis C-methylase UbiE
LVRKLFKAKVKSTDLSGNACKMAKSIFNIEAVACDIHELPFANEEFEAVLCSETIEHVTDYKKAIAELLRITAKVLVITVPHETPEIVAENIRNKVPHGHIHYFDTQTLDYLKAEGYTVKFKKTLSPFLIIPRVFVEGINKKSNQIHYKIYNKLTPIFRKIFGINTANFLTNADMILCKLTGAYGGITFTIEKEAAVHERQQNKLSAGDFTNITVDFFYTA